MGERTGPEGERDGKIEGQMGEKGWEERGPKACLKNSDFGTPMIQVLFSGLPNTREGRGSLFSGKCKVLIFLRV